MKVSIRLTEQQWQTADKAATATHRRNLIVVDFIQEIVDRELAKLFLQQEPER